MNIGTAIKTIRKNASLNQTQLAEASGITQTTLSQIENGVKHPGPGTLKSICRALDIPEVLIHLLSVEETDIPESRKEMFKLLYPSVKGLLLEIIGHPPISAV